MGTRVDFYVGRGEQAEWLGSYPFDGYPEGVFGDHADMSLFREPGPTEAEWRHWVASFLANGEAKSTTPDMGWPWPWETSATTDYAYAWDDAAIYGSCFGHKWFKVDPTADGFGQEDDDSGVKSAVFPDMTARKATTLGPRSGLIVFELPS